MVRAVLYVDLDTAQVLVRSEPLPTILEGIPLDMQQLSVTGSRPDRVDERRERGCDLEDPVHGP